MKERVKKILINFVLSSPFIVIAIIIGIECYDEYITKTKELVIDQCVIKGISYDGNKTLLVVELPDNEIAIVDASIYRSRSAAECPKVGIGDVIRCRWKSGDISKLGYSSKKKGDLYY